MRRPHRESSPARREDAPTTTTTVSSGDDVRVFIYERNRADASHPQVKGAKLDDADAWDSFSEDRGLLRLDKHRDSSCGLDGDTTKSDGDDSTATPSLLDGTDRRPLLSEEKLVIGDGRSPLSATEPRESNDGSQGRRYQRVRALGYIVFAALNISLTSACVKYATRYVTSHEVVFWRALLSSVFNYALARYNAVDLFVPPRHRRMLLSRCLAGMIFVCLSYYAISKMVLSDATVLIFTSPVITFLLGVVVLNEAVETVDLACGLASYIGVVFVARPAGLFPDAPRVTSPDALAVVCALGAAVAQACVYVTTRRLGELHFIAVSHYFSLFGVMFAVAMLGIAQQPLTLTAPTSAMLACLGSATFSCVGPLFLTRGFQLEKAGIASVMRYFDIVFVFVWDAVLLGEAISGYSVLGAGIILSGALVIGLRRASATTTSSGPTETSKEECQSFTC